MKKIIEEKFNEINKIIESNETFKGINIDCILYKDKETYTIISNGEDKTYALIGKDNYEEMSNWEYKYDYVLFDKLEEYEIGYISKELKDKVNSSLSELPLGDIDRFDTGINKFIKYIEE